ncbi:hypothetical protein EDB81DRAFT_654457 [Dactylonectria macrodidyma]|uniref:DUF7702 domain-containing protein n=1 Tax=Dactylonectria macrodidyma TaxID=307937 RepID=A0A9P9J3V3_9HYPO|nr:hypothetical protein EDB81DRAFT_654457 [Dactylonectria macrodidyma]
MAHDFGFRDGVAAAQIPFFSVFLCFGILFQRQHKDGWFGISFFSTIRLIGANCMLATIHADSRGVWAAVFVCESLGLVLLTFVLLNLLKRANTFVKVLTQWHFRVPELICWAGIGISIADYISASSKKNAMEPGSLTRAGVGLFVALYVWAVFLFLSIAQKWKQVPSNERRSLICFGSTIPFMATRIAYTVTFIATGNEKYSAVVGDALTYLLMTMLMEVSVLALVVWAIFGLPRMAKIPEGGDNDEESEERYQLVVSRPR